MVTHRRIEYTIIVLLVLYLAIACATKAHSSGIPHVASGSDPAARYGTMIPAAEKSEILERSADAVLEDFDLQALWESADFWAERAEELKKLEEEEQKKEREKENTKVRKKNRRPRHTAD